MGDLMMSRKERHRLEVFGRVGRCEVMLNKAAELLGLSYRQAKRVYARYREEGDAGLVHRLRGRPSNRRSDPVHREQVLALYQQKYADFGPTLAAEYLVREDGQAVSTTTLRRWLKAAGLWKAKRRRAVHRQWRPRKENPGEMVQMDGSHHDWFEGRRDWACLMVMIDDATNRTYARFFEEETTTAAMTTLGRYARQYGLPRSLYVDHDSIYESTRDATVDEELRGQEPLTQFGRAMQDLGVKLILAHSAQAKGRVERRNAVFQDRLVKALRLAGISDSQQANAYLEETFLPRLNRQFTVAPRRKADLHRRVNRSLRLEQVLSFQEQRVVQNDWCLRWRNRWFQLTPANQKLALVRRRVLVCEQLDGAITLWYRGRELAYQELPGRSASSSQARVTARPKPAVASTKPAADHPWRGDRICPGSCPPRPACSASVATLPTLRKPGGKKSVAI